MRSNIIGIFAAVLFTASGFAETIITAEDYAVDSDVVLESAVKEVQSVPSDTVEMMGDVVKYARDETETAVEGIASIWKKDAHAETQRAGELAVEDAWDANDKIHFRSYKVSDGVGSLLQTYAADKSAPTIDATGFFKNVQFPERTSARYLPEFQSLFVKQTLPNLLAIEDVLASYQSEQKKLTGHQVEIEAKFIEVNQSIMNELGFDWTLNSDRNLSNLSLPAGSKLLSGALRTAGTALGGAPTAGTLGISKTTGALQWDLVISALEQSSDSDVLSAPRVVTHTHEKAVIQVGEKRMVPKSFEIENQDTNPYVQHADWELQLMGVYMEVTPEIRTHDGLIDLKLNTKILDIIGYDPYQITPVIAEGTVAQIVPLKASLPYFRVRKLETYATVADGSTIGMGGLIYDKLETFRDKVPLLGSIPLIGRLFRSEGDRSVKRNLMIFVTATQVDVDGRRSADLSRRIPEKADLALKK